MKALKELQSYVSMELTRAKISFDRLTLRQKEGFLSVMPIGSNQFGDMFERVFPASSAVKNSRSIHKKLLLRSYGGGKPLIATKIFSQGY